MLVKEWMTKEVLTVTLDTSMMKASRLMKENRIGRLPVVDDAGRVAGILSDRDIKESSPSKATSLDVHEMYYLLSEMKVKDIMTKNPVCARENDSVEGVALTMMGKRFGGMPVLDAAGKLCGIITDSDIFKVLISITGVKTGGIQLAFELANTPGTLRPVLDALREHAAGVVSVLTSQDEKTTLRRVYVRLRPLDAEHEARVVEAMRSRFPLIYWESGLKNVNAPV